MRRIYLNEHEVNFTTSGPGYQAGKIATQYRNYSYDLKDINLFLH